MSTNIQALAASPFAPVVVAAAHVALSKIAAAQAVLIPPPVTIQVLTIFAAVHVARSALAATQPVFVPPFFTVHVLDEQVDLVLCCFSQVRLNSPVCDNLTETTPV